MATKPVMTGARCAFVSMETTLSLGSTGSREEGEWRRVYSEGGTDVAVMERVGETLIVDFLPPADATEFAAVMQHYKKTPGKKGWLRFERPATRDPRPALEAGLGGMLGAASHQRRQPAGARPRKNAAASAPRKPARARRQSILSAGGPYLGVPKSKLDHWAGAEDGPEAYEALARGGEGASLTTIGPRVAALVIGTPDPLYWVEAEDGGVLVSVVSFDADDDVILEAHLAALPADGWKVVKGALTADGPIWVFDSASSGGALGRSEALELNLKKGRHAIEERTWRPDKGTELFLIRLRR